MVLGTVGCGLPKRQLAARTKLGGKMSLQVNASNMANHNSPVAMDIVVVSDKKLLDVVGGMNAGDWFQKRSQVQLDHPGKIKILTSLELVPGQTFGPVKLSVGSKFVGGFIFLNYFSPGAHRALINIRKPLVINLLENDFAIQPEK
jgi:type VI secretion system protein